MALLFLKLIFLAIMPLSAFPSNLLQKKREYISEATLRKDLHFEVTPTHALIDQEVSIKIKGLPPNQKITVKAETIDHKNVKWTSAATFQANHEGIVSLDKVAPIQGSYQGIDSMGLFWSLKPEKKWITFFKPATDSYIVNLTFLMNHRKVKSIEIHRLRKSPLVRKILVEEEGLVGALFLPPSEKPLPVVVTLNGFNGGLGTNRAQLLASHGFAVLALGYFGCEGLPPKLENIPLEYFEKTFAWLKSHPAIDGDSIGLFGISRGAELSLLLGSLFPDQIRAIVATVPSSTIFAGLGENKAPAWTYNDKPIGPSISVRLPSLNNGNGSSSKAPLITTPIFLEAMKDASFETAAILVENIRSPLLLISGGKDQMWPSSLFAQQIEERLSAKNSQISFRHLHYPNAGHQINIPHLPTLSSLYFHPITKIWFSMGGSPQEDDFASRDSWHEIIAFFHESFKDTPALVD